MGRPGGWPGAAMMEFWLCFVPLFVAVDAVGVPLITGPAVLTPSMLPLNRYGAGWTAAAIVANILIAGIVFFFAGTIGRVLGRAWGGNRFQDRHAAACRHRRHDGAQGD